MKKINKKILLGIFSLFHFLIYSSTLEEVNYKNGEIILKFDEKLPEPIIKNEHIKSNNIKYNVNEILIKNQTISKEIEKNITINDKFFKNIIIENTQKNELAIYTHSQYGYKSKISVKDNIIKIKSVSEPIPKRISPLTKKILTITLDAGHGGHDSGARGFGKLEKEIALEVVLKLAENLKRDHKIILTRNDDTFIPLNERPEIGNRHNTDLFVSIHLNASNNPDANGAEIFYFSKESNPYTKKLIEFEESYDKNTTNNGSLINQILGDFFINRTKEKSAKLAEYILNNYSYNMNLRRRGIFGANFAVLRGSESASMLIELGFITNSSDLLKLVSEAGQEQAVILIADAIREQFEE